MHTYLHHIKKSRSYIWKCVEYIQKEQKGGHQRRKERTLKIWNTEHLRARGLRVQLPIPDIPVSRFHVSFPGSVFSPTVLSSSHDSSSASAIAEIRHSICVFHLRLVQTDSDCRRSSNRKWMDADRKRIVINCSIRKWKKYELRRII